MDKDQFKPVVVKTETAERDGMTVEKVYYQTAAGATKTDEQLEAEGYQDKLGIELQGKSLESALIDAGQLKEALEKIREKSEITDPDLIKKLCDLADPEKPGKRGRPSLDFDLDHQDRLKAMVAYYVMQTEKHKKAGVNNPATRAREDVSYRYPAGNSSFEQAHKKFRNNLIVQLIRKYATEGYIPEIKKTNCSTAEILKAIFDLKDTQPLPLEKRIQAALKKK